MWPCRACRKGSGVDLATAAKTEGARATTVPPEPPWGHGRITFVSSPVWISVACDHSAGFEQAFAAARLPVPTDLIRYADFRQRGGYGAIRVLLKTRVLLTAFFPGSKLVTLRLRAARSEVLAGRTA